MNQILDDFLKTILQKKIKLYGVIVNYQGRTIAENYFGPDIPRNIFSVSKNFLTTAVGILIEEGKLKLSDRPLDYFPNSVPANLDMHYEELNLQNLLTMTSGHSRPLLNEDERNSIKEADWIRYVLSQPIVNKPGQRFMYSNGSAYLAGCMAEVAAGMKLKDFLYEKLFVALDIPYPEWQECPMGHTFAASTLKLRLSDMIKLGDLYLNRGTFNGKRIISSNWVDAATSFKVRSRQISFKGKDERYGYGYYFWLCRYPGVYRAFGKLGQFVIIAPHKGIVIAISANENNEQRILDIVWSKLLANLVF